LRKVKEFEGMKAKLRAAEIKKLGAIQETGRRKSKTVERWKQHFIKWTKQKTRRGIEESGGRLNNEII